MPNCASCVDGDDCQYCDPGYVKIDDVVDYCITCDAFETGCTSCYTDYQGDNWCNECALGYGLEIDGVNCFECSDIQDCLECVGVSEASDDDMVCTLCNYGQLTDSDGYCLNDCVDLDGVDCIDCPTPSVCDRCRNGFSLNKIGSANNLVGSTDICIVSTVSNCLYPKLNDPDTCE